MENLKLYKVYNSNEPLRWRLVAADDSAEAFRVCLQRECCISKAEEGIDLQESNCRIEEVLLPGYKITVTREETQE